MDDLGIYINGEFFDLIGNESIVQSFSTFNFDDISSRSGEYTNVFTLPLTSKNKRLIGNAQFITSVSQLVYTKIAVTIYIKGLPFKNGFIVIETITDSIKCRFYSGNSNFFNVIKSIFLTDLDWAAYDHIWNYTNVLNSLSNTSGYTYPLIDYNGQTLTGDVLDVRKVLPGTFAKTILDKIVTENGYTYDLSFVTDEYNDIILPYSKKNPSYDPAFILLHSVNASMTLDYPVTIPDFNDFLLGETQEWYTLTNLIDYSFNTIAPSTGTYFNQITNEYTSNYTGNYDYDVNVSFLDYAPYTIYSSVSPLITGQTFRMYFVLVRVEGTSETQILRQQFNADYNFTGQVYLNSGQKLRFYIETILQFNVATYENTDINVQYTPIINNTTTLLVELNSDIVFNSIIPYALMLPKIKCSDFLRDICIRFGLILDINEDEKYINFRKLDSINDNVLNAIDWSSKFDESEPYSIEFKYDTYAQNNIFKHVDDKLTVDLDIGTDYNLIINNANLELEKVIYTSPFAGTDNVTFDTTVTSYIDLYDTVKLKFNKDIKPRILFSETVNGLFKITDGTTTSSYINIRRVWFIDNSMSRKSMGFQSSLIPLNSDVLINTLQNIRILRANFNLKLADIKNLDYFTPVYVDKLQSYFFISEVKQFNYTNPNLTEVELIKLNI